MITQKQQESDMYGMEITTTTERKVEIDKKIAVMIALKSR